MRMLRTLLAGTILVTGGQVIAATGGDDDWQVFGRVLALVQSVVHQTAQSNDPRAIEKAIDGLLSGEHIEANRLAGDLLGNAFEDIPVKYKASLLALTKDLAVIARKERARQLSTHTADADVALRARKDLAAMGLRYFDAAQFLDAIKRDDALAVELFVVARGVDLGARDTNGMTAVELAQQRGNRQIADLLATVRR